LNNDDFLTLDMDLSNVRMFLQSIARLTAMWRDLMRIAARLLSILLASLMAVTGCGGGSSGPAPIVQPPPPTELVWDQGNWDELNWQ